MSVTYALAVPEPRAKRHTQLYGTRAQLAAGGGDVEGHLALAGCDKRAGTASYALRIVNQSSEHLRARMTCATLRGEAVLAYPLDVQVAPFSISETLLPVRIADVGPYDRAIVHVAGGDVAFSLEAPAPPRSAKRSRWILAAAAALTLTLGSAFAAAASTPHLSLLAAPNRAFGGTALDVPYAFGGWASLQYELQTPDGRQLSAGLLTSHQGTLHFSVPPSAGSKLVLSVAVDGPFGHRSRKATIAIANAVPKPKATSLAAPHVAEFAVATSNVRAGEPVRFTYMTDAREGEIWLLDEAGRLWARAPISPYGETSFTVPQGAAGRQMRAVLHARSGKADSVASLGFTVLPGAVVTDTQSTDSPKSSNVTMMLSSTAVAPGDVITVTLQGAHGDARVSLTDGSGNAVDQGDIPSTQDAVTLTAPSVATTTTYFVMASISQGVGEQTVVRKVVVTPR
jgi:hypothetical protein